MLKIAACISMLLVFSPFSEVLAMPIAPMPLATPLVQKARIFCYNTYTGRFLHWGRCGYRYSYRRHYLPRVYCRTRYGHHFLHWGRC